MMRHSLLLEDLGLEKMPRPAWERQGDADLMRLQGERARLCGVIMLQNGGWSRQFLAGSWCLRRGIRRGLRERRRFPALGSLEGASPGVGWEISRCSLLLMRHFERGMPLEELDSRYSCWRKDSRDREGCKDGPGSPGVGSLCCLFKSLRRSPVFSRGWRPRHCHPACPGPSGRRRCHCPDASRRRRRGSSARRPSGRQP